MLKVERDITIARQVEEVFAFVADFDHFTLWSTDVVKAELLNGRRVGVGTRARITRRALGQNFDMLFEMVHFEPPRHIGFKGEMLGVPCPTTRAIVHLASLLHGTDFWESGRTVDTMGLRGLTLRQIRRLVLEGCLETVSPASVDRRAEERLS